MIWKYAFLIVLLFQQANAKSDLEVIDKGIVKGLSDNQIVQLVRGQGDLIYRNGFEFNLPPELDLQLSATNSAGNPTDIPFDQGIYYVDGSWDFFLDVSGSVDNDGTIDNVKVISTAEGVIYDGPMTTSITDINPGVGTSYDISIEITDDDGAKSSKTISVERF